MRRTLIASATVAALLALSACSSDDDDDTADETSEEAPGGDSEDREILPGPSGTSASGTFVRHTTRRRLRPSASEAE